MDGASRRVVEISVCGPDDPDGRQTASLLAAYFDVERARAFRRLLCRRLAIGLGVACLIDATTALFPRGDFLVAVLILGAAASMAILVEWRAERVLNILVEAHPHERMRG